MLKILFFFFFAWQVGTMNQPTSPLKAHDAAATCHLQISPDIIICCWTQFLQQWLQWSPGLHSEVQLSSYRCSICEWWFMGFKLWTSDTSARSALLVGRVRLHFNAPTLIFYLFLVSLSQLPAQSISGCHTHKKPLSQKPTCPLRLISYLSLSHSLPKTLEPWLCLCV